MVRVIISAGGTGGHIYPALAIIDKIKEVEPNSEFLYIGTHNRMEKDIVPKYHIPFKTIEIYGVYRKEIWKNVKTLRCFIKAISECKKWMKEFRPDVVIGVGGYVTGPVIYAAHKLGIPTFIHEQNSVPGRANLFLSKYVDRIGVSFPSTVSAFPKDKVVFTGNPCSEGALKKDAISKKEFGLSVTKPLVMIVMGSLGASKINEFMVSVMSKFEGKKYEVLFVTGKQDYDKVIKNKFPSNVKVVPYIEDMSRIMKKTDLIVSRAGASTLSEIIELGIPSILIPSPYVPNNHQYKNALDLVKVEGALLIEEKDLNEFVFIDSIDQLLNDTSKLNFMKKQLKELSVPDSASKIVLEIQKMIDRK